MIKGKSECHVRLHDKDRYVMSIDMNVPVEKVVAVLMRLNTGGYDEW